MCGKIRGWVYRCIVKLWLYLLKVVESWKLNILPWNLVSHHGSTTDVDRFGMANSMLWVVSRVMLAKKPCMCIHSVNIHTLHVYTFRSHFGSRFPKSS